MVSNGYRLCLSHPLTRQASCPSGKMRAILDIRQESYRLDRWSRGLNPRPHRKKTWRPTHDVKRSCFVNFAASGLKHQYHCQRTVCKGQKNRTGDHFLFREEPSRAEDKKVPASGTDRPFVRSGRHGGREKIPGIHIENRQRETNCMYCRTRREHRRVLDIRQITDRPCA